MINAREWDSRMNIVLMMFTLLLIISFSACKNSPEFFMGKWQIESVNQENETIILEDNWMHLKSDGTFESFDGSLSKEENGLWKYQQKEKVLFIDGEGSEGDSEWILSMKKDTLFFHSTVDDLYLVAIRSKN